MRKLWLALCLLLGIPMQISISPAQEGGAIIYDPDQGLSTSEGSWGTLTWQQFVLEPPDYFLDYSWDLRKPSYETVWRFNADTPAQVSSILSGAGFSQSQIDTLTSPRALIKNRNVGLYETSPPDEIVLSMTPEQRMRLYPQLEPKTSRNPFFRPYFIQDGGIDAVTANFPTPVSQAQIQRIRQLTYSYGFVTVFSDIDLVLGLEKTHKARFDVLKTIHRHLALSVSLSVTRDQSLAELVNYWGAHGRNRDFIPLLESVIANGQEKELDIIHLLPPIPRKFLNTYPSPHGDGIADTKPDCFWTALNFFEDSPSDRYFDTVGHVIAERYERAHLTREFGDLVLITETSTGDFLHGCNVIAGNLVYTKNGNSMGKPWIISTLEEVIRYYAQTDIEVTFFRLKPEY